MNRSHISGRQNTFMKKNFLKITFPSSSSPPTVRKGFLRQQKKDQFFAPLQLSKRQNFLVTEVDEEHDGCAKK